MSNKPTPKKTNSSGGMNVIIGVLIAVIAIIIMIVAIMAINLINTPDSGAASSTETSGTVSGVKVDMTEVKAEIDADKTTDFTESTTTTEYVKISVKDHGDIILRLRPDVAPITVKNFQKLVGEKFYDGLTFHRIIENFMIQGGDPQGDGTGGSSENIKGEFQINGVENNLSHVRGVLSMARRSSPYDSASSQFFICNVDSQARLDGQYAAFGYVVAGMDTVDSITAVEKSGSSPLEKVVIERACFVKPN